MEKEKMELTKQEVYIITELLNEFVVPNMDYDEHGMVIVSEKWTAKELALIQRFNKSSTTQPD